MWGVAALENLNTKAKYECLGRPLKIALPSDVWRQGELVMPVKFPKSLLADTVHLGSFGLATTPGTRVGDKMRYTPLEDIIYHAPERYHNVNPGFASDIWSYMCLFIELYIGFIPWDIPQ